MHITQSAPCLHYKMKEIPMKEIVSREVKSEKSFLPGKKWCCHRSACGYISSNIRALGGGEAVQGGFICIVAVQCCFSQALSTSLCHKLRYLKTKKKKAVRVISLKLTCWPLLIQKCLWVADGVREAFHSLHLCWSMNMLIASVTLIYSTSAQT